MKKNKDKILLKLLSLHTGVVVIKTHIVHQSNLNFRKLSPFLDVEL